MSPQVKVPSAPSTVEKPSSAEPLVTVGVLCYNLGAYVEEALDSIANQTFRDYELIVIDDCSSDNSVDRISRWVSRSGLQARIIRHERNVGLASSHQELYEEAAGRLVAKVDADDRLCSDRLERQVQVMMEDSSCGVCHADAALIDEKGVELGETYRQRFDLPTPMPDGDVFEALLGVNLVNVGTALVRREAVLEVGGFDLGCRVEDYDMWLRLARTWKFTSINGVVGFYRLSPVSMSATWGRSFTDGMLRAVGRWADTPDCREAWARAYWELTWRKYGEDRKGARAPLRTLGRRVPSSRNLAACAAAHLGVSRARFSRLVAAWPHTEGR